VTWEQLHFSKSLTTYDLLSNGVSLAFYSRLDDRHAREHKPHHVPVPNGRQAARVMVCARTPGMYHGSGTIVTTPILSGLHHRYARI
jgi:hypothetical protein